MDATTRKNTQLETNPLRDVQPVELMTDGIRHVTFARQLEDESGSSAHHTGQLSQKIVRCFGKKSVKIIEPRENEGSDESVACIAGEHSTNHSQLTYVKVQCTCKLGDMSYQAQRQIQDDT